MLESAAALDKENQALRRSPGLQIEFRKTLIQQREQLVRDYKSSFASCKNFNKYARSPDKLRAWQSVPY